MKRRRFIATAVLSAALTGGLLTACDRGGTGTAGGDGSQVLTMATSADYPPYEFVETAGGTEEIVGFDVDIARAITERLGYELEISNIDFNGLIPALQAGRADFVMAGMTPTEERRQNVDFSEIYYTAQQTIVSQQNSGISAPEDLAGRRVGVQLGSIQEGIARDLQGEGGIAMEIVPLNRINEIVQEVRAGRIDAAIIEDTVAAGFLQANTDLQAVDIPADGPAGSAIAFPQGSELVEDFNRVLQEMQESGEIDELVVKWFGDGGNQ
jgi:arginine/lysine/histidine transporter system substrate-binding protein